MKKLLLFLSIISINALAASAQTTTTFTPATNAQPRRIALDKTTVVRDSVGVVKSYAEWNAMLQSGKYRLLPVDPTKEKVEFKIVSRSASPITMIERSSSAKESAQPISTSMQQTTQTQRQLTVDENSVVKDSSGVRLPFVIVQKLVNSNDYWLKPVDATQENTEFVLTAYTEEQKTARYKNSSRPRDSKFFTTGAAIKPFKIKDNKGQKIEAKDWTGKTVVLNFWFIGCPPCRAEMPDLNKLALKYKDNPNVIFIAIALDPYWEVTDFVKTNPLAYHLVGDGNSIARQFSVEAYPTNVVIDKQGKVALHYSGGYPQGPYWMDKMIQESEALKVEAAVEVSGKN